MHIFQDKIPLNDESTLSEQCVEGTGVVKVSHAGLDGNVNLK